MATIFGQIGNPYASGALDVAGYVNAGTQGGALIILVNNLIKFSIVIAGIYSFINIIIAGYTFLSSPESKEIGKAWARIYQSMYGLLIIAGAFVLAAIFGWIIFGDATILLVPRIYTP
jgi:hypothetical protein